MSVCFVNGQHLLSGDNLDLPQLVGVLLDQGVSSPASDLGPVASSGQLQ